MISSMLYYTAVNDFSQCPTEGAIGLLTLLIRSGRGAETRLDDALASVGLTFVKWRALDALAKSTDGPVSLKCLPHILGCVKSNVTQLVDWMEAEGIARREADPEDRRGTRVALTEAGRDAHRAGREALEGATRSFFARCDRDEQESLRRLLRQLEAD